MTEPFKMDLLLQHSSGAHSAVNDGGWGPKKERNLRKRGDGLCYSAWSVLNVGFSLPRLMEKCVIPSPFTPPPSPFSVVLKLHSSSHHYFLR